MSLIRTQWSPASSSGAGSAVIDPSAAPYNATGNGTANDTTALTAAIAALTPGATLWIAPGKIYTHTTSLDVNTAGVTITGGGEIRATAEATSAFRIYGNHVTVEDITFTCPTTTQRWDTLEHQKLQLHGDGQTLRRVTVSSSAAAGIFTYGASNFVIDSCYVTNTRADAYHSVKASHHGLFTHCLAYDVGDDGFAAVAYATGVDAGQTHHIRFQHCKVINPVGATLNKGRMFGCAGATDVDFLDCYGEGSYAAGLIVVNELSYQSHSSARVFVRNLELRRSNTLAGPVGAGANPDHGAVVVSAERDGTSITDVTIRNVRISGTRTAASREVGILKQGTATVSNVLLDNIQVDGTGPPLTLYSEVGTALKSFDVKVASGTGWNLLAAYRLATTAVTTGAITIPKADILKIIVRVQGMTGGADIPALRFNGDAGNNYWSRFITAAQGAATLANVETATTSMARLSGNSTAAPRVIEVVVNNNQSWEKPGTVVGSRQTAAPGTPAPLDVSGAFEWVNAAAQITSVELRTVGGTVQMNDNSGVWIFGQNL